MRCNMCFLKVIELYTRNVKKMQRLLSVLHWHFKRVLNN
nr:MAG TPA: hypothetical protein [Inoviridae sp.]